jgi:hypothetical protein
LLVQGATYVKGDEIVRTGMKVPESTVTAGLQVRVLLAERTTRRLKLPENGGFGSSSFQARFALLPRLLHHPVFGQFSVRILSMMFLSKRSKPPFILWSDCAVAIPGVYWYRPFETSHRVKCCTISTIFKDGAGEDSMRSGGRIS